MDIEKLISGLKEQGLEDEAIKEELLKIKEQIEAYLNPQVKEQEETEENENDKQKRVFGI